MSEGDAADVLSALRRGGADPCLGGGWAVDALLGEQTRRHADLDLWLAAPELEVLIVVLAGRGIDRLLPWGGDRPWNFVLHDGGRLRVDLHLYERRGDGRLHYGSAVTGTSFPARNVAGRGRIAGEAVRCETPDWALACHTGYRPGDADRHDVGLLCRTFGLELPPDYA